MFLAKEGPVLPQDFIALEHETMGPVTIFLVPRQPGCARTHMRHLH